jgi:hypothetical protein
MFDTGDVKSAHFDEHHRPRSIACDKRLIYNCMPGKCSINKMYLQERSSRKERPATPAHHLLVRHHSGASYWSYNVICVF